MSNYKLRDCPCCGRPVKMTDKQIVCQCGIMTRKFKSVSALVGVWNSYGASHWKYNKNEDMYVCANCGNLATEPWTFCNECGKKMDDKQSKVPVQRKDGLYQCLKCGMVWDMKLDGKRCPNCKGVKSNVVV